MKCRAAAKGFSWLLESPQCLFKTHAWKSGRKLTWIKEDDGFKASILVVINLDVPQGFHQLIQDSGGHTSYFQFWAVHWDDEVIPWGGKRNPLSQFRSSSADTITSRSYPKARCRIPIAHVQQISSVQLHTEIHKSEASHGSYPSVLVYIIYTCRAPQTVLKACSTFCSGLPSVIPSTCLQVVWHLYFWHLFF